MAAKKQTESTVTITVSDDALDWAINHINNFIASKPVSTEPLAHELVSAISNAKRTPVP
jgi:hypothetical protein